MKIQVEDRPRYPKVGERILTVLGDALNVGKCDETWRVIQPDTPKQIIIERVLDMKIGPTHGCACQMSDEWHESYDALMKRRKTL